jgi:hypothetical protein
LSILGGKRDKTRQTIRDIKAQISDKEANVLLYSFRRWAQEQCRMGQRSDTKTYSAYVKMIVSIRLLKLLADGFSVCGIHPSITHRGEFYCSEGGNTTLISAVQIDSSKSPDVLPRPITPEHSKGHGRGQGKGHGRGQGKGRGRGQGKGRGGGEGKDDESESESESVCDDDRDKDVKPYYWCNGCLQWHEIVTVLLS